MVSETVTGRNDGKITGVTEAMEYSADNGENWTPCTGTEITGLEPGKYQVRTKATAGDFAGKTVTLTIEVGAEETSNPGEQTDPLNGNITKETQVSENVPKTEFVTPLNELVDIAFTEPERKAMADGDEIKIILTVEDGTDLVDETDKEIVEAEIAALPDYNLGQYLDVNLLKIINERQEKITETTGFVTVSFEVPETLRGSNKEYVVIRIHNGESAVLPDLDDDENTITIQTDRFSTYAIAYSEKPKENSDESPNTGMALPILPLIICGAALTVCVKQRRKKDEE